MAGNLDLWNVVERTPPSETKPITGKSYSGTSPKPYWLVKKATETFGPCGIGWGFTIIDERIEDSPNGDRLSIARVRVWYKWHGERGEVEHVGGTPFSGKRRSGDAFIDEDAVKKSVTDALVKALSMIGFAGDIFIGRYDDSKYVGDLRDEERSAKNKDQVSAREARNAGGSSPPAPLPAKGEPPATMTTSQKAYVDGAFAFALNECESAFEISELMRNQKEQRAALGITSGSEAGKRIMQMRDNRLEAIGATMEAA